MTTIVARIVEIYLFRRIDGCPWYLVLRRSAHERLYPGIWQVITGTMEPGETAVQAARREAQEETGLTLKRFWSVPGIGCFYDAASDTVQMCPQFAGEVDATAAPTLSAEHQEFQWMDVDRASGILAWPGQRQTVRVVHDFLVTGEATQGLTLIE